MRWDKSPECRAIIDRNSLQQQQAGLTPDLHTNDLWHERNLALLEQCLAYARNDQVREYGTLIRLFWQEEHNRLEERIRVMIRCKIERLPSVHGDREHALVKTIIAIFKEKGVEEH